MMLEIKGLMTGDMYSLSLIPCSLSLKPNCTVCFDISQLEAAQFCSRVDNAPMDCTV